MSNRGNRTRSGHRSGLSRPDFGREDEFFVAGDPGRLQSGRDEGLPERGRDRPTWFDDDDDDYGAADQSGTLAMIKNHSERVFFSCVALQRLEPGTTSNGKVVKSTVETMSSLSPR
jgi:hypothetical protein